MVVSILVFGYWRWNKERPGSTLKSCVLHELIVHIVGSVVKKVVGGQLLVTVAKQECLHC